MYTREAFIFVDFFQENSSSFQLDCNWKYTTSALDLNILYTIVYLHATLDVQ